MRYTTPQDRIAELVREYGSYQAVADALGMDIAYIHRVAHGKRYASARLLDLIGLEKRVLYTRVRG